MTSGHPSAEAPSRLELLLAILTAVGHVGLELVALRMPEGPLRQMHMYFSAAVAVPWIGYFAWRLATRPGTASAWGLRLAGFRPAIIASAVFAAVALVPLTLVGWTSGRFPPPRTFWLVMAIYPLWGLAQQFVLQVLVTRNLRDLVPRLPARVLAAAALFCLAHFPNWTLMLLTLAGGIGFTWIYEKRRNLWAVGLVHGLLGATAYYLVLGEDPGAAILGALARLTL
ncbi:MAG: CPBP family glutamic-type intramembrane protease [Verrucomicrobiota bacterium]